MGLEIGYTCCTFSSDNLIYLQPLAFTASNNHMLVYWLFLFFFFTLSNMVFLCDNQLLEMATMTESTIPLMWQL